jgi:hypothetical protein
VTIAIVATVGGASANSFVTVAVADAYLEMRRNASAWNDDDVDDDKMQALCEATRELSAIAWQGSRVTSTQALAWPRSGAVNPDGTCSGEYYDEAVIPQRIKDATCELALEFLKAGTTDLAAASSTDGIKEKTVDVLTTVYADPSQRAQGLARFPRVMKLIGPLLEIGSGQVRLVR